MINYLFRLFSAANIKNYLFLKDFKIFFCKALLLLVLLFVSSVAGISQNYSSKSKKAIRFYEAGISALQGYKHTEALNYLQQAINKDDEFIEAYIVMGDAYFEIGDIKNHIKYYRRGLEINPEFYITGNLTLSRSLYLTGQYKEALPYINRYVESDNLKPAKKKTGNDLKDRILFSIEAIENPVDFKPESLKGDVNSQYSEYWPSLSADEKQLIFTRLLPIDQSKVLSYANAQEDFYVATRIDQSWSEVESIGAPINTNDNEGAQTVSADGRLMVFTGCNRKDGFGNCDLYFSLKEGDKWSIPKNMGGEINTPNRETQPALSADGRKLFFASNRSGGLGGMDIYESSFIDGKWMTPENLGKKINTSQDEVSPFIHFDNQTLYFSSEGHIGLGKKDIFMSKIDSSTKWSEIENVGYPINDYGDQIGLIIDAKGLNAYYASTRPGFSDQDIYTFEIPENMKPLPVSYVKGNVYDKNTRYPVKAIIELINLETGKIENKVFSDKITGNFLICLPVGSAYAFNANAKDYLFYSENFSVLDTKTADNPQVVDIPLEKIEVGSSIILKNIFFETDSHILKDQSKIELQKIYEFLTFNNNIRIEINGHTDNVGTEQYNMILSQKRAESVQQYLISMGINESRIIAKGEGESHPIASNDSEEGRALNRRTEFTIISK